MRLENGMIEEVQRLHDGGVAWERLDYYGLEYRYIGAYLQGKMNRNDMFQRLNSAIHDFAKRQENWFRKMEKNGVTINWVEVQENRSKRRLRRSVLLVQGNPPYKVPEKSIVRFFIVFVTCFLKRAVSSCDEMAIPASFKIPIISSSLRSSAIRSFFRIALLVSAAGGLSAGGGWPSLSPLKWMIKPSRKNARTGSLQGI